MRTLIGKIRKELIRYIFAVESRLPHRHLFARQQRRLYGALSYLEVLSFLHGKYRFRRYLEIGIDTGMSLSLSKAEFNCGVDPEFAIRFPLSGTFSILRTTSDRFFESYTGERFDCVFIDGLHLAGQLSTDVFNALRHLDPNGLIIIHDTVPYNRVVASPKRYTAVWTGDVYRGLVPYIECGGKNVLTLLVPPSGLTLMKSPRQFLEMVNAPPAPSGLRYGECMALLLRGSQRIDDIPTLERVLAGFYPGR